LKRASTSQSPQLTDALQARLAVGQAFDALAIGIGQLIEPFGIAFHHALQPAAAPGGLFLQVAVELAELLLALAGQPTEGS
jgi:hypothetical protein